MTVVGNLIENKGTEVVLRLAPAAAYGVGSTSFAALVTAAQTKGEVALGYLRTEGMEVVLAPPLAPGARPAEGEEAGAAPATATSSAPGAAPAVQTSAPPAAVSATEPPTAVARPDGDAAGMRQLYRIRRGMEG